MSLRVHDGDYFDCGNDASDVFDTNTGIWWHCGDDNITQISDLTERFYIRESHKRKTKKRK